MRVLVTMGTRPEALKLAPLINLLEKAAPDVELVLVSTAQHRELLDPVLNLFDLRPDYDLGVMRPGQSLAQLHARLLTGLNDVLEGEKPDRVIVQGDTTTAMAAAQAAFYQGIPVAHVEAGLRSHDPLSPFPEEANRRAISLYADLHFAPTVGASKNLIDEGIPSSKIRVTGNSIVDALETIRPRLLTRNVRQELSLPQDGPLLLVTAHRRENHGDGLRDIAKALEELATPQDQIQTPALALILHPNPAVQGCFRSRFEEHSRIRLLEPMDYPTFLGLLSQATVVLSDSGGVQEEAPSLKVPLLVLRDSTERPEGIEAGVARLVGTDPLTIVRETNRLLRDPAARQSMLASDSPYGDGRASERMLQAICESRALELSVV
ncbi:MAG: UDP-N-acetylglucosamine 2-epimerase (non-hydrolyzing) [Planctomycetota bacterium]